MLAKENKKMLGHDEVVQLWGHKVGDTGKQVKLWRIKT